MCYGRRVQPMCRNSKLTTYFEHKKENNESNKEAHISIYIYIYLYISTYMKA